MTLRPAVLLPAAALAGCNSVQSALDTAGPAARSILDLGIGMTVIGVLVLGLVTLLLLVPLRGRRENPLEGATRRRRWMLFGGGIALPGLTLTALLPFVLMTGGEMRAGNGTITVKITGHQFWWQVAYQRRGLDPVYTANELVIPVGMPVRLELEASDVIHSFWVPSLAGKTDMIPGRTNRMTLIADRPGVYRGQCAEFCGLQHAIMALDVEALEPGAFLAWLARRAGRPAAAETPQQREGERLFMSLGCGGCHTVSGLSDGRLGPDLSFVASRRTIGAGLLPNGVGNLAAWISTTQHLKPGAKMPSYDQLSGPELRALSAYLAALK